MSYVFTSSNQFGLTLESIVKGLNRAGFSKKDFREIDETQEQPGMPGSLPALQQRLFDDFTAKPNPIIEESETDEEINVERIQFSPDGANASEDLESFKKIALETNEIFEKEISENEFALPPDLEEKTNMQKIKEIFAEQAKKIKLPQFFLKVHGSGGFFDEGENLVLFEKEELLKDFKLSNSDVNINFETVDSQVYRVDLEQISEEDYTPTYTKVDALRVSRLREKILSLPSKSKIEAVNKRFCELVGNMYPITDQEIKRFVQRILDQMNEDQIRDCVEKDFTYGKKIKTKINDLARDWQEVEFLKYLETDKIVIQPNYELSDFITPAESNFSGITKSLYESETSLNGFEHKAINEIANLENVAFGTRLLKSKDFGSMAI